MRVKTGVVDKAGVEICVGDIVEVFTFGFHSEHFITEVIEKGGEYGFKNGLSFFYFGQTDLKRMGDAKVIGSIYDKE